MARVVPIHRIPAELVSEIFIQCMHTAAFEPDINADFDEVPLLLGRICSRWRNISLSTPRLWSSFGLSVWKTHCLESHVMLAKTWLARAGTCPLSIALCSVDYRGSHSSLRPLVQVILQHCNHWRNLYLSLPLPAIKYLEPAKNCIPQLQWLRVYVHSSTDPPSPWQETIDIFEHAPQLHSFHLVPNFPALMFKAPYHQLKHSDLFSRNVDEALKYLSLTSNLETCILSPLLSESQCPPVLLRNLRYMHVVTRGGDLGYLFDRLLLPMLRELSIWLWNILWIATSQLISLLSRGSLEKLTFYSHPKNRHPRDEDMIKVFLAAPSLTVLDLKGSTSQCLTKSFLTQFTYYGHSESANTPQLLPRLQTIKVDYTPSFFDILGFADAIQSRITVDDTVQVSDTGPRAYLRTVQIRCFPVLQYVIAECLDSAVLSRLQQLRNFGLDLSIIHGRNVLGEFTI